MQSIPIKTLVSKVKNYSPEQIKRNRLLKSFNLNNEDFIEEFAFKYTGIEIENWSDTTFELFEGQVQNDYRELSNSNVDNK
ncbi:hypothetical protein JQK62_24610, partial [Leptospira santarosai]|nr:hypothetical protein [Leptospira santarosai]